MEAEGFVYGDQNLKFEKPKDSTRPIWHKDSVEAGELITKGSLWHPTVIEGFESSVKRYPESNCLGYRTEEGYDWVSYEEVNDKVQNLAKAIWDLKLAPEDSEDGLRKMGLFASNIPEWVMTGLALQKIDASIVTLYATLGDEQLSYCVD